MISLLQLFMKMKKQLKFEINALYQRINGEINRTYQVSYIGYKENEQRIKTLKRLRKKHCCFFLNDGIKYLSFEDKITACKKWHGTMSQMQVYYKGIKYSTCIQCLPEEKRKAALEKIEFGKGWQAMPEKFGID